MGLCPTCGESNPDRARFCSQCATPLDVRGERAERKIVTALFCDLVGSTALGETHDPEVLEPVLARYFAEARAAVEHHGGRVEKFIGDAVAAVFGVPAAHEDDALRAARAALEIQERVRRLREGGAIPISCRIGLNTGEVLTSGVYAPLVGDAMNVAARLQAAADPDGVLIGEETWRLVRDAVRAEPVERVVARGKAEPVPAWRLFEVIAGAEVIARHLESPLVGRVWERGMLADALARAVEDESVQLVTVVGPAGIGKTRLVEEFVAEAGPDVVRVRGRCLAYGEGITFWPIAEIVRDAAGIREGDDAGTTRARIASLLPDGSDRAAIVERVTELLGLDAVAKPDETFWAVRKLLEALAAERPVICVIEDLHWAELRLLDLVDHVADWSRGRPILLLCTARPELLEKRPGWAGGKLNAVTSLLRPLSTDEIQDLIANLAGGGNLDRAAVARVVEAAEGNPLFVEQLLAMLADQGILRFEGGRWTTTGEVSLVLVPPTIQALLGARLDELSPAERRLLEAGAVEGRTFHLEMAAVLCDMPRADAGELLIGLVRKELLRPDRALLEGDEAFRFRHILITDAAYGAIPKRERADLHERFAGLLEARLGERVAEAQEILGHHLERAFRLREELGLDDDAGLASRAASHLADGGHRALARGDAAAASVLLQRAVDLVSVGPDQLNWVPGLAWAMLETGRATAAIHRLDDAIASTSEAAGGVRWHRLRVERILAEPEFAPSGSVAEWRSIAEEAVAAAEAAGDDVTLARALTALGYALEWGSVDLFAARDAFERAAEVGIRSGDLRVIADAENYLGGVYAWGPFTIDEAVAYCGRSFGVNVARDRLLNAYAVNCYARWYAFRGEYERARVELDRAADTFAELGSSLGQDNVADLRVRVALLAQDREGIAAAVRDWRTRDDATRQLIQGGYAWTLGRLAYYLAQVDEVAAAEQALAGIPSEALADEEVRLTVSAARLRLLLLRDRGAEALTEARRAVAHGGENGWLDAWIQLLESAVDVFEAAESHPELSTTLDALADACRRKGNLVGLERTERRIAALGEPLG